MNVRLSPACFNVAGERAFWVDGYTDDEWMNWRMMSAPLTPQGRPDMTQAVEMTPDSDWTGTPFEGQTVSSDQLMSLGYWMGNTQREFQLIPASY